MSTFIKRMKKSEIQYPDKPIRRICLLTNQTVIYDLGPDNKRTDFAEYYTPAGYVKRGFVKQISDIGTKELYGYLYDYSSKEDFDKNNNGFSASYYDAEKGIIKELSVMNGDSTLCSSDAFNDNMALQFIEDGTDITFGEYDAEQLSSSFLPGDKVVIPCLRTQCKENYYSFFLSTFSKCYRNIMCTAKMTLPALYYCQDGYILKYEKKDDAGNVNITDYGEDKAKADEVVNLMKFKRQEYFRKLKEREEQRERERKKRDDKVQERVK